MDVVELSILCALALTLLLVMVVIEFGTCSNGHRWAYKGTDLVCLKCGRKSK